MVAVPEHLFDDIRSFDDAVDPEDRLFTALAEDVRRKARPLTLREAARFGFAFNRANYLGMGTHESLLDGFARMPPAESGMIVEHLLNRLYVPSDSEQLGGVPYFLLDELTSRVPQALTKRVVSVLSGAFLHQCKECADIVDLNHSAGLLRRAMEKGEHSPADVLMRLFAVATNTEDNIHASRVIRGMSMVMNGIQLPKEKEATIPSILGMRLAALTIFGDKEVNADAASLLATLYDRRVIAPAKPEHAVYWPGLAPKTQTASP